MPSLILGPVKITSVSGTVLFGDTAFIAPKSASKTYNGSGSGDVGDFQLSFNGISSTNTFDSDLVDDNINSGA